MLMEKRALSETDKKLTLIQWMVGFNLAISVAALWKLMS